ncbi:MAG: molybdenum ABC transporter ATP-binding protein [Hyphomicrobiales bacterium]
MIDVDIAGKRGDFDYAVRFKSSENVTALFGASGVGKTTVIDALSGDMQPDNGRIDISDAPFYDSVTRKNMSVRKRRVGHVFQDGRLFPHMSVKRNLTYARWAGWRSRKSASFDDVVALLGLGDLLTRMPGTLSGGEKQRVAIGRALLSDPRVLLMDEPLSGLDYQRKSEIMPYLERLAHESGVPIIYVSHDLDEVVRLAGHLVLMDGGRVVSEGPIIDVLPRIHGQFDFARHAPNSLLKAYFGGVDDTYSMTWLTIGQQKLIVPEKLEPRVDAFRIRIDASDVALSTSEPADTSFQNILHGRILGIQHYGGNYSDVSISIDGQALMSRVTRKACDELGLEVEKQVFVLVKSVAVDGVI